MTNRVRLVLILACLVVGIWLLVRSRWEGALMFVAAALFLWGRFRYSTVWSAFRAMRTGDFARARGLVEEVKCSLAEVVLADGPSESAEKYLARAFEFPHSSQLDLVLIELQARLRAGCDVPR